MKMEYTKLKKDCFALRFNLQRCGYDFPDDVTVFSKMFSKPVTEIEECMSLYDEYLNTAATEILNIVDMNKINEKLSGKTMLMMGDSITSDRLSYGKIMAKLLPAKVVDCAVSGSRTIDVNSALDRCLKDNQPDIVSVMIGTNDHVCLDKNTKEPSTSIDEFKRNLGIIAKKVQSSGARLVMHTIPKSNYSVYNTLNGFWSASPETNSLYNEIVLEVAQKYDAIYNNALWIFDEYPIEQLFEPDGIHLSPFGQKLWAQSLAKCLVDNV